MCIKFHIVECQTTGFTTFIDVFLKLIFAEHFFCNRFQGSNLAIKGNVIALDGYCAVETAVEGADEPEIVYLSAA